MSLDEYFNFYDFVGKYHILKKLQMMFVIIGEIIGLILIKMFFS